MRIEDQGGYIMENTITPTNARKDFFNLIKKVNEHHKPITIKSSKKNEGAVIIGLDDWNSIQETLYLENIGVGKVVRDREQDSSGFTNIDDINWDEL